MIRKDVRYATHKQLMRINERIEKMSGFRKTINSMSEMIDNCMVNQRILNNEIRTLHKKIDNIETRLRNALRNKLKDEKNKGDE